MHRFVDIQLQQTLLTGGRTNMTCTHCQQETAGPEYCGHCGRVLMVPCPECGEMEPIKRKHCLKRIRTGRTSLQEFRPTEKPAAFMSIRNTPIFIVTVPTSSIAITVAFFAVLFVLHRVPDPLCYSLSPYQTSDGQLSENGALS